MVVLSLVFRVPVGVNFALAVSRLEEDKPAPDGDP